MTLAPVDARAHAASLEDGGGGGSGGGGRGGEFRCPQVALDGSPRTLADLCPHFALERNFF